MEIYELEKEIIKVLKENVRVQEIKESHKDIHNRLIKIIKDMQDLADNIMPTFKKQRKAIGNYPLDDLIEGMKDKGMSINRSKLNALYPGRSYNWYTGFLKALKKAPNITFAKSSKGLRYFYFKLQNKGLMEEQDNSEKPAIESSK